MQLDRNFIEELKARVKLSDVIGRKLRLTRRGREFVALSPFSNEKSPSFTINDDKGFYHCFSTGKHGDAITFIMETENLGFAEAVTKLAGELGMTVPVASRSGPERDRAFRERRAGLYEIMGLAAAFYREQLALTSAAQARAYLERRRVPLTLCQSMGLGYAPKARSLLCDALRAKGAASDLLVEAGLAIRPEGGDAVHDRFRDRIMFPITDNSDRVIAFGGRAMSAEAQAKYLNSPETPLFHKGNVLYNLANARRALGAGNPRAPDTLIVAEGYMDVIALTGAGITNAVAPLGTALTETQLGLLWKFTPEPILCFDGDAAGRKAALRAVERALPLLKPGHSLQFAIMPQDLDPDDVINQRGMKAMQEILARPVQLIDLLWSSEVERITLDTPERRAGLEGRLAARLKEIADQTVRNHYQEEVRARTRKLFQRAPDQGAAPKNMVGRASGAWKRRAGGRNPVIADFAGPASGEVKRSLLAAAGAVPNLAARRERVILSGVLHHPELLQGHLEVFCNLSLADPGLDRLRSTIIDLIAEYPGLETGPLQRHLIDLGHGGLIDQLTASGFLSGDWYCGPGAAFADAQKGWLQTIQLHARETHLKQAIDEATEALAMDFSHANEQALMALQKQVAEELQNGLALGLDSGFGEASGR